MAIEVPKEEFDYFFERYKSFTEAIRKETA